jgi:hypothetical protein
MDGYEKQDEQLSTEDILERIMEMRDQAGFLLRDVYDRCKESYLYLMAILVDLKKNPLLNKDQRQLVDEAYIYASEIEDACITIGANAGDIVFIADELQQKVQKPLEEKSTTSS